MRFRNLVLASICSILPLFAADKDDEADDFITVYKVKLPLQMPKDKPDESDVSSLKKNEKYKKMFEAKTALQEALQAVQTADAEPDPKKKKRNIERAVSKLDSAAKKFFKEFDKCRKNDNDEFNRLKKEKEKNDKAIEEAEEKGDDKKATKLAQDFDKKNSKYEALQKKLEAFNSLVYFDDIPDVAQIISDLELKENAIPEIIKIAETMSKDDKKDKDDKDNKKVKAAKDDKDDKDDAKPEKKSKKKKSKKKDDED